MNSAKAGTSTPQRPARTATRLRTRRGLSGSAKKSSSRLTGTVSERLSQETDDKLSLNGARTRDSMTGSPVIRQPRTVFLDMDNGSPVRIPNSQAPIPGREVFWDLDTPETKRNRDALIKKMAAKADSPVVGSRMISITPKMKLIPRKRAELDPGRGVNSRGLADLEDLMNLAETASGDDDEEESSHLHLSKSPRTDDSPQRRGELSSIDSGDMFDEDFGDDDDAILLLSTQQPIEEGMSVPTPSPKYSTAPSEPPKPQPVTPRDEEAKASAATNGVGDNIDDFFGDDDEFDDVMSQMEMPEVAPAPKVSQAQSSASSLTLAPPVSTTSSSKSLAQGLCKPRTPSANVRNSTLAFKGFESEFDDSFDNVLLSQIEDPDTTAPPNRNLPTQVQRAVRTSGPLTSTQKPSPLAAKTTVPVVQPKPKMTFQFPPKKNYLDVKENVSQPPNNALAGRGGGGPVRKFRSFNSPPREKKLIAKFKSDPLIPNKPPCSKEEIERKKKEAMARKQMLQSQKQQRS